MPTLAHAQDQAAEQAAHDQEARALFDAGEIAYADGRYDAALTEFRQAFELSGRQELLYNIGLAAERLRRDQEALDAYRAYIEARPDAANRAAIESRIHILEAALAQHTEPTTPTEPVVPPQEINEGGITVTVAGGVVAIVGLVFIGLSASDASRVMNSVYPAHWSDVRGAYGDATSFSIAGGVLTGVGVACAIGGAIWLAVGNRHAHETQVSFGPSGLSLRGTF